MRVALIIECVEPWRGGAETSTAQFARRAVELGCQVTLLTTTRGEAPPGVGVRTVPAGSPIRARRTALFVRRAAEEVRCGEYDVVHAVTPCPIAHLYEPRGGAVPETLRRNLALRRSVLGRTVRRISERLNMKYRVLLRLERRLVHREPPPIVIALSRYVAEQFRRYYGLGEPQVRTIFNGVEPDRADPAERDADNDLIRRQYDLAPHESLVLCVAHNFRLKGVRPLVEAVALVPPERRRRMRVIIVGRDNPIPFVRLARRLGVEDRIVFAGSSDRICAFYHAADMLVHPTYYDPCSRVVLEALTAGVPVITTRYNGAAEAMTDGREGFVLDSPDDVAGLADRMVRLLDDFVRARCAAAARRAGARVGMDRHAEEVVAVYREICEARSCRASRR